MSKRRKSGTVVAPPPVPEPLIPAPVDRTYQPFIIDTPGWWLILSDVHLPYHDCRTIELAIAEAKANKVVGVLLNGDILDMHGLSRFDKDPTAPRYIQEREAGLQLLSYVRYHVGKQARIVWKEGNHEERLIAYLLSHAPALFGIEELGFHSLMKLREQGVEWVGDRRVIRLGKLNVVHGHEYRPTIQAPVNPARGLFLRAKSLALCGHFHQTSEHHEPNIAGKSQGAWSTGCACQLHPLYLPLNRWNLGFCMVHVGADGGFAVRNLRVVDNEVV